MMLPECIFAAIAIFMGILQLLLALYAARRNERAAMGIVSSPEQETACKLKRVVYGFVCLAVLSFLTAAFTVAIPLYLQGRYGF